MSNQYVVAFSGVDGAGKSTTSEHVLSLLSPLNAKVVWCGAESLLMRPVRFLLRLARPSVRAGKYSDHKRSKHGFAMKYRKFTSFYIYLVLLDYKIQYLYKRFVTRKAEVLILDRCFYDVAVNLAIALNWNEKELLEFVYRYHGDYQFPDQFYIFLVRPEVSMKRKDDIPDLEYIRERLVFYRELSEAFGFKIVDGEGDAQENSRIIAESIKNRRLDKRVHYAHANNSDVGGADYCLARMAHEVSLIRRFRVTVSIRESTSIVNEYSQYGIPLFINGFSRLQVSKGLIKIIMLPLLVFKDVIYFGRFYLRQRIDVVHVNDLNDLAPAFAAKILSIPVCYHIRMIVTNRFLAYLYSVLVSFLASRSISVSEAVRLTYFEWSGGDSRHRVIYDWPGDVVVSKALHRDPEVYVKVRSDVVPLVIFVGRLEPWKGQSIFLDAVEQLTYDQDKARFAIVGGRVSGKEEYAEEIESRCKALGVDFLGERFDVAELLEVASIAVHCSLKPDPFPGAVLEAMLSPAVVVATKSGGVVEMIDHGIDGFLFEPGDASELGKYIKQSLVDIEFSSRMSRRASERILNMLDKRKIVNSLSELYREISP